MGLKIENLEGIMIITPEFESIALENREEIIAAMTEGKQIQPKAVILDLINVAFIDSMGLGAILTGRIRLRDICEVHLCGLSRAVEDAIRVSRLNLIFETHRHVLDALKAVQVAAR
jgi:anti-anti-sigma factor